MYNEPELAGIKDRKKVLEVKLLFLFYEEKYLMF